MKNLWFKIPEKIRGEIKSAIITFVSVFIFTVALQYSKSDISFSLDALAALALSAVRAGVKAVATLVVSWITNK